MWERSLQDLIRGLRANKRDEATFIAQAMDEIRNEVKSKDMDLKAAAVLKLTYLGMLGYDMKWASFSIVEVMSSPKFHLKSVGYLAAIQSFNADTDVLMLTTNLLKKDLSSTPNDAAITLNGLSHISNHDIARDLSLDIISMLNHSRAHIRKRSVLAFYTLSQRYPEIFERGFPRLKERLDDPDPGVVSATVNVLCELAQKKPADLLVLAPQLFHILQTSNNNWMLIKIIKLFGALTPHEPRLVKKLQPPITNLISTTPAISLLYECVRTCITGGMLQGSQGDSLARTCVTKLAGFLEDSDQNLKYIALLALVKIVPSHPHLVAQYQTTILASVNDIDISIRMRALELVSEMVNVSNIQSVVQQLLSHLSLPMAHQSSATQSLTLISSDVLPTKTTASSSSPLASSSYRHLLTHRILAMTSKDGYASVDDFEWYFAVLIDLVYLSPVPGPELKDALIDVVARVGTIRPYAVKHCARLLGDETYINNATISDVAIVGSEPAGSANVLSAAAWICGEFAQELNDPPQVLSYLLRECVLRLPHGTIAVFIHAVMKIFGVWAVDLATRWNNDFLPELNRTVEEILLSLQTYVKHNDIEIQERAANISQLFKFIQADLTSFKPKSKSVISMDDGFADPSNTEPEFPKSLYLISPLTMGYELKPVAPLAQLTVPIPEGLDLDAWINPPPEETSVPGRTQLIKKKKSKGKGKATNGVDQVKTSKQRRPDQFVVEETQEEKAERELRRAERLDRLRDDPFYLFDRPKSAPPQHSHLNDEEFDSIPVVKLDDVEDLLLTTRSEIRPPQPRPVVDIEGEMPVNAVISQEHQRPISRNANSTPFISRPFESYDEVEGTPEPIKVMRSKKKVPAKKKKLKEVDKEAIS